MQYLLAILALLYPFLAYAGLVYGSPQWVAGILVVILLVRLKWGKSLFSPLFVNLFVILLSLSLGYSLLTGSPLGIRLYPVLVNLVFLLVFASSLFSSQTVVERLARLKEPDLPASGVAYTRKVTLVWSVFFILNGTIAAYTAFFTNIQIWTLYNGFISYLLIAILGGSEWLIRQKVRQRHEH
ncbi:hypothetical protein [Neptunicella sp. SCSIO 80796]|uniref:COG4648 family protein n=1 Tax=Neptunicella plasticusilytica TaxID=3117012 RepID=UPI003A4D83BE